MCSEGGGVYTAAEIVQGGHSGGKCALWGDTAAESVHYAIYTVAESVQGHGDGKCTQKR